MNNLVSTTLTPDAIAKFSVESLLGKVSKKKQEPVDLPVYNKLKRSYEAHEKRKLQNARKLRNQLRQCQDRVAQSIKNLAAAESRGDLPDLLEEDKRRPSTSAALIPGFRYRANGDERKSLTDLRRLRLNNSLTGLTSSSPKSPAGARTPRDNPEMTSTDNAAPAAAFSSARPSGATSGDNLIPMTSTALTSETTSMELRHPDLSTPGRPMTTYGYYKRSLDDPEVEAAMRLRKVQEQLGLSSSHGGGPPRGRGGPGGASNNDPAMSDAVLDLEHALKMLHLAFRNQDFEPGSKFGGKGGGCKKTSDRSLATMDSRSSYASRESGAIHRRCQACLLPYKDDVADLVKPASADYRQPRWRFSPSGRYVDPPISALRICHPELFTQSRALSLRPSKKSILDDEIFNADPFFPNLVDLSGAMERRASAGSVAGGRTRLRSGQAPPTKSNQAGSAGTGRVPARLFEEVVRLMGAANRTAPRPLPEQGESSAVDAENRIDDLKSRHEEKTRALEGKVRQFLHALPAPSPTVTTASAGPASASAAAAAATAAADDSGGSEAQTGQYAEDAFGEANYFMEPIT